MHVQQTKSFFTAIRLYFMVQFEESSPLYAWMTSWSISNEKFYSLYKDGYGVYA